MHYTVSEKAYKGMGMEGFTARWYASVTWKALDEFKALAHKVAADLPAQATVLEVAPGPGYFAIELAKLGTYRIAGVDISGTFVEIARRNAAQAGVEVDFQQGDAARLPFADGSFDFLLCRAAFKNFTRPMQALREMYRVLKPAGRAMIIDLRRDASRESVRQLVDGMRVSRLNARITSLTFRFMLLKRAYTRNEFDEMLGQTNFETVNITESPTGFEILLEREPGVKGGWGKARSPDAPRNR